MSMDIRCKLVSFRLTEEEYDRFRDLCYAKGIRTVSEMVRAGINLLLHQPEQVPGGSLHSRVNELESRIERLAIQLNEIHHNRQEPQSTAKVPLSE